jgi:hypothetical protein
MDKPNKSEGHTETTISGDTRADWSERGSATIRLTVLLSENPKPPLESGGHARAEATDPPTRHPVERRSGTAAKCQRRR